MNAKQQISALVALVSALATGCATSPDRMAAAYVSPMRYSSYDCEQLAMEQRAIERRVDILHGTLSKDASNDNAQFAVGMLLFWPALFFLEGGDGAQAAEYQRLKGEYVALDEASVMKRCGMRGQEVAVRESATPAKSVPEPKKSEDSLYWDDGVLLESTDGKASPQIDGATGGIAWIEVPQSDLRSGFIGAELIGFQFKDQRTRVSTDTVSLELPADHYWIALRGRKVEPDTVKLTLEEGKTYQLAYRIDAAGDWIPVLYATNP